MKKKGTKNITSSEIEFAVQNFLNSGGSINQLPEQKVYVPSTIGMEKWSCYENVTGVSM